MTAASPQPEASLTRPILLVGGSPRITIDAVRHISSRGSGETALALASMLRLEGRQADLLLSTDAVAESTARRFIDRDGLERVLGTWIHAHPDGVVVMSAAVNDYRRDTVTIRRAGQTETVDVLDKVPSGAEEVIIRLVGATKIVDQLRPRWGLRGPIVAFKYQERGTLLAAAEALRIRVGAEIVVANSLCGALNAVVDAHGVERASDREALIQAVGTRLLDLSAPRGGLR